MDMTIAMIMHEVTRQLSICQSSRACSLLEYYPLYRFRFVSFHSRRLRPLPPLLLRNLFLPICHSQTTRQMHHSSWSTRLAINSHKKPTVQRTAFSCSMPMFCPRLANNNISCVDLSWLPPSIADPARAHFDLEDLANFVSMPVRA